MSLTVLVRRHGGHQCRKDGYHEPERQRVEKDSDQNERNTRLTFGLHISKQWPIVGGQRSVLVGTHPVVLLHRLLC
jgi:hypothetical protein